VPKAAELRAGDLPLADLDRRAGAGDVCEDDALAFFHVLHPRSERAERCPDVRRRGGCVVPQPFLPGFRDLPLVDGIQKCMTWRRVVSAAMMDAALLLFAGR
jgi:hypothetical protein